uniref:SUMO-conjugating enzyme UBC9 n=1 Tax=Bicosoecida sp. CB-2014 TaxID=1486930 RepID=A0A7S1CNM2_9STRA|mmetsp:Transcript_5618/g.20110  ORF Transcript_5618/g.20110 Transcript_5618/m.20110 type:complete len:164 (+) Transcript_5618:203-694(+)
MAASGDSLARNRLREERTSWRKNRPIGFVAKPKKNPDGSFDMLHWQCKIPGPVDTAWEGGLFPLDMTFTDEYPARAPVCKFNPPLFHPNVYPSGTVCLSILNDEKDWKPTITVPMILTGIQALLNEPNMADPAHGDAYNLRRTDPDAYEARIRTLAAEFRDDV